MATNDTAALAIAREHNVGDVALGYEPSQERKALINYLTLGGNIFPRDLVNRDHPGDNFQFVWVPFNDSEFYYDCKEDGYKPVIEAEWVKGKEEWEWTIPEKDKTRWSETRMLVRRNEFLMYRNEELWAAEQARRLEFNDRRIETRHDESIELAQRAGVEVESTVAGKTTVVGAPKRSASRS